MDGFLNRARLRFLAQIANNLQPKIALDIGCGSSSIFNNILAGKQKVALDIKRFNVSRDVFFVRADALHLPFKSETFDLIVAGELLEHLDVPELCISEMLSCLKRGAYILVSVPNDYLLFLAKAVFLRFISIKQILEEHKHHNLARKLPRILGRPVLTRFIPHWTIMLWRRA